MVQSRPSKTPNEIMALLDALPDDLGLSRAFGVDELSVFRMLEEHNETFQVFNARFTGELPGAHEIGVREATTILGALQEVVSEVGAAIRDESPKRGPLPADIVRATELRLSPHVQPGSVVFSMHPAIESALIPQDRSLLDEAFESVFELFDKIERPGTSGGTPETISDTLQKFGPRTARHLVRFAGALKDNGLNVDLGVATAGRPIRGSRISEAGAKYLKALAEQATTRTVEVDLVGDIHNLGKDNKHKLDEQERGRITITGTDDITDMLQESFRRNRVHIVALETESVNHATGASKFTYEALEVIAEDSTRPRDVEGLLAETIADDLGTEDITPE